MYRKLTFSLISGAGLLLSSCNSDITMVGTTILPPEDIISVYTDTFMLTSSTVRLDSVFAKTSDCLLGEIYDPEYGLIKSDFLCQFYCMEGFQFSPAPYQGKIDSLSLFIMYLRDSWYGDSLVPMQATAYPIVKPLKRNFYSNDNPEAYCDMEHPYGTTSYTARDAGISDSIFNLSSDDYNYYSPHIRIALPLELGQRFYEETVSNPSSFASQNAFNEFFPGVYITTTYGSGNMIKTHGDYIVLRMWYRYMGVGSYEQDTVINTYQDFYVTKEVVQINRFKNSNTDKLVNAPVGTSYVKSPAGVCTRLTVPTVEIAKKIDVEDRFINDFTLKLKFYPKDEWDYAYNPPQYLLILPEDSVKQFFEEERLENDVTSFISYDGLNYTSKYYTQAGYCTSNYTYYFGNISAMLKEHIANAPDKDLHLLAIPVTRTSASSSSSYYSTSSYYTTGISHSFYLSGAKLHAEEEYMKVAVLSSKFENK